MSKWISVDDERPQEEYDGDGNINAVLAYAPDADNLLNIQTCNVRFFNVGGRDYYTHWMPLPNQPEESK